MEEIDLAIIKLLSEGKTYPDVSKHLKQDQLKPNSISIIEKKIRV